MEDEALVAAFMEATGCGPEDAFDRLASCGGHLGKAVNSFFSIDAGSSGRRRRRSPPPSPQVSVSELSSSEEDAVRSRPVVPARRTRVSRWDSETRVVRSHRRSPSRRSGSGSPTRVSRWDSESWSSRHRQRCFRRRDRSRESDSGSVTPRGDRREADGNHNRSRRRRFREDIFADGDEDEESNNSRRRRRRRLNPTADLTSEGEKIKADDDISSRRFRETVNVISSSSDDDDNMLVELEEAARPPPPRNRTFEELFKVPHELTYKGGFHAAKAHAARRARWLLANVQSSELPLPSLHQNRDVWGNGLVAQCVRDRFVLWQADADAADDDEDGEESEAKRVLGYYGIPHDSLPVVVVVDPVTGQAMDVLHGSAAYDLNDFMVRLGPYTDTKPTIPVMAKKSSSASSAGGAQSNTKPATTTTAPTSSERAAFAAVATVVAPTRQTRQEQTPTTTVTKPAVAVAPCTGQQPESGEEKVCNVRVRLADGRLVTKEFGSQWAVAALFAYCRSMMGAGGAPPETPFRLRRIVGRATEEISDQNASFESMGLDLTTVSLHLA